MAACFIPKDERTPLPPLPSRSRTLPVVMLTCRLLVMVMVMVRCICREPAAQRSILYQFCCDGQ